MYFQYQIIMTMIVRKDWVVSQGAPLTQGCGKEDLGGGLHRVPTCLYGTPGISSGGPCHSQVGTCSEAARTRQPIAPHS